MPRHARGEDPVVVVVGDDQILVADPELAGAGSEPISSRDLNRHRIIGVDEVVFPVDEHRAGDMPGRILGVLGVRQRRAGMPPPHIE
jgi:hypothetical protein